MAPPPWLPPLNFHDQYSVLVVATQNKEPRYNSLYSESMFLVEASISVMFSSDNCENDKTFIGLSCKEYFSFNCFYITSYPSATEIIHKLLSEMRIPFELSNMYWGGRHLDGYLEIPRPIEDTDYLVHNIWRFAYSSMKEQLYTNTETNIILPLNLTISKRVRIPDFEINQWNAWYENKKRVDPDFEHDFKYAISRPRTTGELVHETTLPFKAATKSSIDGLSKLRMDEASCIETSCPICFEELHIGSQIIRLPCSHVFHEDCVVRWLQESHLCPLCRFSLPSV